METSIKSIAENSIAEALGLRTGDKVLSVNGRADLEDMFDYQFELVGEEDVTLEVRHPDGQIEIYEIEKDPQDDLGITFDSPIFTPIKTCNNACPFCFIDQQPEGLRPSLYVKDDDYRLSYFCNTYITLTNLTRHDRERIERIRPGPLYVSVHSTVPEIRQQLLKNPKGGNIMEELSWLASLDIPFHAQLVICPGINDGDALTQSLQDLASLAPSCQSIAVVPVGLTEHRTRLPELIPVDAATARDVVERLSRFEAETKHKGLAFASDEFYVKASVPIPAYEAYGDFPQLDDGVGTARLLTEAFFKLADQLPEKIDAPQNHVVLTGKLGQMVLQPIVQRLNQIEGLYLDLIAIENRFWGEAVTVAGLITGQDILETLINSDLTGYKSIIIPQTMLKSSEDIFLDGLTVTELSERLNCPIEVVRDPTHAHSLLQVLFPVLAFSPVS